MSDHCSPRPTTLIVAPPASTDTATAAAATDPSPSPTPSTSTEPAVAAQPPDHTTSTPAQLLSSIRSGMERRSQNWRSNLSNVFQEIRPLVQQVRSVSNATSPANPFHDWTPQHGVYLPPIATQSATPTQPQFYPPVNTPNPPATRSSDGNNVIIDLDRPTTRSPNEPFVPAGGYTLIDMSPAQSNTVNPQSPVIQPPTILDSRRAQILADLQQPASPPPPSTPSDPPPPRTNNVSDNIFTQERTNNVSDNIFTQEIQCILETTSRYIPYILIVVAKSMQDHIDGILDVFALVITFTHANWVLRQEVGRQAQRSIFKLVRELVYIVVVVGVFAFMLEKKNIYYSIVFAHKFSDLLSLRNLLFSVIVTDFVLKLITVAIKILVTLMPASVLEYKYRGRVYLAIESVSQLYRGVSPILPWLIYLMDNYVGFEKFLGVIFSAAYIAAKGSDLLKTFRFVKHAFLELFKQVNFGAKPTKEQLQSAGAQCPICHDSYNSPVLLVCNHIFCETCVGTWFDREPTCPLCRAKVADDPAWRDGATTMFVQMY